MSEDDAEVPIAESEVSGCDDLRALNEQIQSKLAELKKMQEMEINIRKRIHELSLKEAEYMRSSLPDSSASGSQKSEQVLRQKQVMWLRSVPESLIWIGRRLGTGGSGAVVHACVVDGWNCVVKMLPDRSSVGRSQLEAFEREMELMYSLPTHPNLVKYLFHREVGGRLCLFMSQHEGTLSEYLKVLRDRQEFLATHQIVLYSLQIINGIQGLHEYGVVHRDIKSENVFYIMTCDSINNDIANLVIADFDTAKFIRRTFEKAHSTIGTVGYMAPEVFNASESTSYSFPADIYSFGMVLFEIMTLHAPWQEETTWKIYTLLKQGARPSFTDQEEERLDPILVKLFFRCTSPSPADRPSIPEIIRTLQQACPVAPVVPKPVGKSGKTRIIHGSLSKRRRRHTSRFQVDPVAEDQAVSARTSSNTE